MLDVARPPRKDVTRARPAPSQPGKLPLHVPEIETRDLLTFLLKLVVIVLLIRSLLISPFNIPRNRCSPACSSATICSFPNGPMAIRATASPSIPSVRRPDHGRHAERGDVAWCSLRRAIRMRTGSSASSAPGDYLQVRGGVVYLNGQAVPKRRIDDLVIPVTASVAWQRLNVTAH